MMRALIFLAVMLFPFSAMAIKPISDTDMSEVTGQAGVSINADITMNLSFAEMGWGDPDGYGSDPGGWVGIDSLSIDKLHIWPRTDFTMESNGAGAGDGGWRDLQFLTIDVVTMPDILAAQGACNGPFLFNGQAGRVNDQITAVRIGIPTFTITMEHMAGNVVLGPYSAAEQVGGMVDGAYVGAKEVGTPGFNQLMGKFDVSGLNMAFGKGGSVLISAHGGGSIDGALPGSTLYGSGVTIELQNVNIPYLLIDHAAWGDIDGN